MDAMLQEIVKHLGRPIDTACTLIENILSVPTKKLGDLLGDQISYWQWSNRIKIAEKAVAKMAEKGINIRVLPLDFAVPFIRDCGDAENPDLQEWWAELLASAIQDDSLNHIAFVKTLQSMSPADVKFLETLISIIYVEKEGRIEEIAKSSGLSIIQATISSHNLQRLGFFSPAAMRLSGFAYDFLQACSPNRDGVKEIFNKQSKLPRHLVAD